MRRRDPDACVDCGVDGGGLSPDYCMLRDPVWQQTGLAPDGGMLCLDDIERRIGRPLRLRDFRRCHTESQWGIWGHNRMVPPGWQKHLLRRRLQRRRARQC